MLLELTIENFAIIPKLHLTFHQGMTALTGETGAGKSIIIDAMGLLSGGRGSNDYIRQGADKCVLEGLFDVPTQPSFQTLIDELGIDVQEEYLIVQRDLNASGKSICRVNGRTVTLANLRKIGSYLVDIQGQNDHQALLQPEQHLQLVDALGSTAFRTLRTKYETAYTDYQTLKKQVRKIQQDEQSYVQRMDMLRFQQEEIAEAQLMLGEEEQLQEELEKLNNYQKIVDALQQSYQVLSGNDANVLDSVSVALNGTDTIAHLADDYHKIAENIQSAYYLLQDAAGDLSRQLDTLELDEGRLEEVNQRLEVIRQLKRKYGTSVADILAYYDSISQELAAVGATENQLEHLEKQLVEKEVLANDLAEQLHQERRTLAHHLEKEILQELAELYLENTRFEVRFMQTDKKLTATGYDVLEFYLSTNPGEDLKPLAKVASGGELSRILLALKTIFSKEQGMTSIIFDEVDTGVSGRVAQAIAEKIAKIAQNSQVLCITHLPQVAAVANYQYFISKSVHDGRTTTNVAQLPNEARVKEIARMLAGAEITDLTIEHAKELLTLANK